jgi:hypothetical protein
MKYGFLNLSIFLVILLIFDSNAIQLNSLSQSSVEKRKKDKKGNILKDVKEISGLIKKFDNYEKYNDNIFTLENKLEYIKNRNLNKRNIPFKNKKNNVTSKVNTKRYLALQSFNQTLYDFQKNKNNFILSSKLDTKKLSKKPKKCNSNLKNEVNNLMVDMITTIEKPLGLIEARKFNLSQSQSKNYSLNNDKIIDRITTVEKPLKNIKKVKTSKYSCKTANSTFNSGANLDLITTIEYALTNLFDTNNQMATSSNKSKRNYNLNNSYENKGINRTQYGDFDLNYLNSNLNKQTFNMRMNSSLDEDFQLQKSLPLFNHGKSNIVIRKVPIEKYFNKEEVKNKNEINGPLGLFDLISQGNVKFSKINHSKKNQTDADDDEGEDDDESLNKILNSYHFKKSNFNKTEKSDIIKIESSLSEESIDDESSSKLRVNSSKKNSSHKKFILNTNPSSPPYKYNSIYELIKLNKFVNKNSLDTSPPIIKHIMFSNSDKPIPLQYEKCSIKESDAILTMDQNKRVPVRIRMTLNNLYLFLDEESKIIYKSYDLEEIREIKKKDEFCCFQLKQENGKSSDVCGYGDVCTTDKGENQFVNKWISDFKAFKEDCKHNELSNKVKKGSIKNGGLDCTNKINEDDYDEDQLENDKKIKSKSQKTKRKKIVTKDDENDKECPFKSKNIKILKKIISKRDNVNSRSEKKSTRKRSIFEDRRKYNLEKLEQKINKKQIVKTINNDKNNKSIFKRKRNNIKIFQDFKYVKNILEKKSKNQKVIKLKNCKKNPSTKNKTIKIPMTFTNNLPLDKHSNYFVTRDKFNQFNTEYYNHKIRSVLLPVIKDC